MKLAREGIPFVLGLGGAVLIANLLAFWWLGLFSLILTLAVAAFFRDPERDVPEGEDVVVSPADGRVVAVEAEAHAEVMPQESFQRVAIFMSPMDVHVNRIPVSGEVLSVRHTPGRFLAAYDERASRENERNAVELRDRRGRPLVLVQVAGLLARRIVCHLHPGQLVEHGARFGLIMFGSRVDVYLPRSARVRVKVGERVHAGSAIIAEYPTP
jgi:phosphatidylserine decarboxylase